MLYKQTITARNMAEQENDEIDHISFGIHFYYCYYLLNGRRMIVNIWVHNLHMSYIYKYAKYFVTKFSYIQCANAHITYI